jgi:hypothetical protein
MPPDQQTGADERERAAQPQAALIKPMGAQRRLTGAGAEEHQAHHPRRCEYPDPPTEKPPRQASPPNASIGVPRRETDHHEREPTRQKGRRRDATTDVRTGRSSRNKGIASRSGGRAERERQAAGAPLAGCARDCDDRAAELRGKSQADQDGSCHPLAPRLGGLGGTRRGCGWRWGLRSPGKLGRAQRERACESQDRRSSICHGCTGVNSTRGSKTLPSSSMSPTKLTTERPRRSITRVPALASAPSIHVPPPPQ